MEQDNPALNQNILQSHIKMASGNNHGPSMLIPVTVYPKSTPGESKQIQLNISKTSTVSGFKGNLCAQGFNVFLQYDLFVGDKKLDVEDDRLLCVHVGIKADQNANSKIIVKPKADNDPSKKPVNDEYDPFMASSNSNTHNAIHNQAILHDHNVSISKPNPTAIAMASANATASKTSNTSLMTDTSLSTDNGKSRADQIEMYKAYEEMFGVEEAAGMMGLDPAEIKKHGIECILKTLEEEKIRKQQDQQAAEAARSTTTMNSAANAAMMNGMNPSMMSAQNYYSEEMLYAQALQAAAFTTGNPALAASGATGLPINPTVAAAQLQGNTYNGIPTNENLIDFDTAPGTTHTAGGGTVSRPPPAHVSENACIFVGDLHPMVTRSDLLSVFSQIGSVQWIQLFDCHKQMNRPFNFAFVYFEDILVARNAITTLNYTKFYGSPCRLMWKQEKNSVQWTDCNIIVKNLPPNTDSQLLHAVFSKFGKILSSKVKTTATGRTLPYGYVQYATKDGADKAIIASDKGQLSVNGHLLTAEWFKSREDRAFRQIYVKNIPSSWSDEDLLQLFEAQTLGKIKSFTVKHSPYGRWACISFHEPHHAVKAIEKLNNCPTGDPQSPTLSVSRFMYKTERDKFKTIKKGDVEQCYSIYVGNVPLQLTDEHMRQLFEPFGAVISAAVVQKTEDYKYGFVNFEQPEDAARALVTMNGKSIGGKTLQVKPANTDMSKAIAITQAADYVSHNAHNAHNAHNTHNTHHINQQRSRPTTKNNQPMTVEQAKAILAIDQSGGKKEKVWKVQYGEDWHEYDQLLAAIVEQLTIGEQIQITLADSNYIITRIQETEAMQKNCASGTMRKVVRSTRDI